jgi:methylisocitrate lyase
MAARSARALLAPRRRVAAEAARARGRRRDRLRDLPPALSRARSATRLKKKLRPLIAEGKTLVALGATDALSAKLIESHGFECVYIGSYATAASRFGIADTGALSLPELAEHARTIVNAVGVPVIADAEGGFHDAANLWRTVQAFEQAGVAAIHIEDHAFGKHAAVAQKLRPADEAAARIRAAVEARQDPEFMIIARSDAFWVHGDVENTVARLKLYAEAGADLVFPTLVGPAELAEVRRRVAKPAMVVDMPGRPLAEHKDAAVVLYYAFSALAQFQALNGAIERFRADGSLPGGTRELEKLLGYDAFAARARKYGES